MKKINRRTQHTSTVDYENVAINEEVIKHKVVKSTSRKSKVGSKINRNNLDLKLPKKQAVKIYKKAKKDKYFTLKSFCDLYRPYILVSYEFVNKEMKPKNGNVVSELAALLINKGILEITVNKNKVDTDKPTRPKYFVAFEKRKDFARFIKEYLVTSYQKDKFMKNFGNSL